jgi:hypothetical protein
MTIAEKALNRESLEAYKSYAVSYAPLVPGINGKMKGLLSPLGTQSNSMLYRSYVTPV